MNTYKCSACGKKQERNSGNKWIRSYCDEKQKYARLVREPDLFTRKTFKSGDTRLIIDCPDDDNQFAITIKTGSTSDYLHLDLGQAKELSDYLKEHIKNALECA